MSKLLQMRAYRQLFGDVMAAVSRMLNDRPAPIARDGIYIGGTYDPKSGTIEVILGDTASMFQDDGDNPASHPRVPLATTHIGDQAAPAGINERVLLIPTQSGYIAIMRHGDDDSPNAPAGERWITHRNPTTGTIDSHLKLTNDGPTVGDGKGGTLVGGNGAQTKITTSTGHVITLNDTAKTVTVTSAGGHSVSLNDQAKQLIVQTTGGLQHLLDDNVNKITHTAGTVKTILDGAGNIVSHVATTVNLGASSGLSSINAAMRNSDISAFESSLFSLRLDDLTKFATAMVAAAVPNAGAVLAQLATLTHVSIPPGSSNVFIK